MVYMRKIDNEAWDGKPADDSDSISDLATKNHELSVWRIKDDLSDIDEIALALAMTRDNTKGIMVVLLSTEDIKRQTGFKINIEDQEGQSAYLAKNGDHKNFMLYNVAEMAKLAAYIHLLIGQQADELFRFYDEPQLVALLKSKFRSGEIDGETVKCKGKWYNKYKEYKKESAAKN